MCYRSDMYSTRAKTIQLDKSQQKMLGKIFFTMATGVFGALVIPQFMNSSSFDPLTLFFGFFTGLSLYTAAVIIVKMKQLYGNQ